MKIVDMHELLDKAIECAAYIGNEARFNQVEVQPDGYGVRWSKQAVISDCDLYSAGVDISLSLRDFCRFVQVRVINTTEACQLLIIKIVVCNNKAGAVTLFEDTITKSALRQNQEE